jgi:predicted RND superfamily exporter protein
VRDPVREAMDMLCRWFADAVASAPSAIALLGMLVVLIGGWLHLQNEPRYSYATNLPETSRLLESIRSVNEKLAGANTLDVLVDFSDDHALRSFKTLEVIRKVHKAIAKEEAFGAIASLHTIELWIGGN